MRVDLHPTFVSTPALHLLRKSTPHSMYNLEIRPGPEMAGVLLRKHRLYMHEYATCPPLTEMRLTLIDDESDDPPEDNDTIFSGLLSYRVRPEFHHELGRFAYRCPSIDKESHRRHVMELLDCSIHVVRLVP